MYFRSVSPIVDPATGLPFPVTGPPTGFSDQPGAGIEGCQPCALARFNTRDIEESAVFGEISYKLFDSWEVMAGLRQQTSGTFTINGVNVTLAVGDTPAQIETKIDAAMDGNIPPILVEASIVAGKLRLVSADADTAVNIGGTPPPALMMTSKFRPHFTARSLRMVP